MKHFYLFIALLTGCLMQAQGDVMQLTVDGVIQTFSPGAKNFQTDKDNIMSFTITYPLSQGYSLKVTGPNNVTKLLAAADLANPVTLPDNLVNKQVLIQLMNGTNEVAGKLWGFTMVKTNPQPGGTPPAKTFNFDDAVYNTFTTANLTADGSTVTPFGIVDKEGRIHIYLDYRGNNLMTTIPSGISNAQYVVHVISPYASTDTNPTVYTIKQKSGSFNDALNFRNSGAANQFTEHGAVNFDSVRDDKFLMATSTDNISFDLVAVQNDNNTLTKNTIDSYTITMSPTYQGSFDIGFINTELTNPTYSLVNSPDGTFQTVKKTGEGSSEGVATVMATFYYSPVVMLESVFGKKKVPFYKLNGRNFLDDHKFYERFYPTVGVGLNDKVFQNFFFGVNWEIVRGFAVFYGWNYRKVNTFTMPDFEAGVTPVTQDQFNYYTNEDWKTKPAYGIKMDLLVVMGLFGK